MKRRAAASLAVVSALVASGGVAAWRAGAFASSHQPAAASGNAPPAATQAVERRGLSSSTPVNATLGYAGSYTVAGQGGGTLTWLPWAGHTVSDGQVLYRVDNGTPVVLLYGSVPDWRAMSEGVTGADVRQLNHDLVSLGYASSAEVSVLGWDYYSWETAYGVGLLEEHAGVTNPPGSLSLGSVVFEPTALRVATVTGSLGGPASGPVLTATSDQHVVTIALDASMQSEVTAGDAVSVTLPDGLVTSGVISSVGAVASGSGSNATIPVDVRLTHPQAAGSLDEAPVTVNITTASSPGPVLVVPVTALQAQASGGYDVEVAGPGNTRRYVAVSVGPVFDDTDGLVQVTGALTPGQRVVVPTS